MNFKNKRYTKHYFIVMILMTLGALNMKAQEGMYPEDYFRPPLGIPIYLSGTFGELRSNHFHSGIDIKTG
ncbi:MAG: M23 family peptidase, partial [Bacteroidales bacterium]|nr:M23 family peptidase [Bacteroidales bacterium]